MHYLGIINQLMERAPEVKTLLEQKHARSPEILNPINPIFSNKSLEEKLDLLVFIHLCKILHTSCPDYNFVNDKTNLDLKNNECAAVIQLFAKEWQKRFGVNHLENGNVTHFILKL